MLMQNLRGRIGSRLSGKSESGFTLIELLVVMLILGILAAIAIPAFFNQKSKANDAKAKSMAHSAQVAMETCATDNNGSYVNCNLAALNTIEPTIPLPPVPAGQPTVGIVGNSPTGYTITVTAPTTENQFQIIDVAGRITYPCLPKVATNRGGCPAGPSGWG